MIVIIIFNCLYSKVEFSTQTEHHLKLIRTKVQKSINYKEKRMETKNKNKTHSKQNQATQRKKPNDYIMSLIDI